MDTDSDIQMGFIGYHLLPRTFLLDENISGPLYVTGENPEALREEMNSPNPKKVFVARHLVGPQ